jgi:hypothetical protein
MIPWKRFAVGLLMICGVWAMSYAQTGSTPSATSTAQRSPATDRPGRVRCGSLVYGRNLKTSRCFADHFLADTQAKTNIWTARSFEMVKADSPDLFDHPFVVMSGEGAFELLESQRRNLRAYLEGGGFLVASPGCSSASWMKSFRHEMTLVFPKRSFEKLPPAGSKAAASDPIYHTVYDIGELQTKKEGVEAYLEVIRIDGRIVLVYSSEGLNDTANAGGKCCCCGGNEVRNARQVNVNLLAYALTH